MISINGLPNLKTPYFRYNYKRYYKQNLVEIYLCALKKINKIDELSNEFRIYIPTVLGKKQVFIDFVIQIGDKIGFIEVDGPQHCQFCEKFHKNKCDWIKQLNRDRLVNRYCSNFGKILHISTTLSEEEIEEQIDNFIQCL